MYGTHYHSCEVDEKLEINWNDPWGYSGWEREIVEWNVISTSISNSCASLDSFPFYVTENFQHCIFLYTSSNARRMLSTVHPLHPVSVRCSPNAQSTRSIRSNTKFQPKAEYEVSQWKFTSPNRVCDFPIHPQLTPSPTPTPKIPPDLFNSRSCMYSPCKLFDFS